MTSGNRSYEFGRSILIFVMCGMAIAAFGYWRARSFAAKRAAARSLVADGRHEQALPLLNLARGNFDSGILDRARELDYLEGLCRWRTGEIVEATTSLKNVPPDSPLYGDARLALAEVELDSGRWSLAESVLLDLLVEPSGHYDSANRELTREQFYREEAAEIRKRLMRYYRMQGRYQDAARVQLLWLANATENPVAVLKSAWRDERGTPPFETIREAIAIARKLGTEDRRVTLAEAMVATAEGRYDEAEKALKSCETPANQPDEAVLRARLDWMRASGRPFFLGNVAWGERTSPPVMNLAEKLEWADFLADRAGNVELRRRILDVWKRLRPRSTTMLSRSATFLESSGKTAEAREMLRLKGEVDRAIEKYGQLMTGRSKPADSKALLSWARDARAAGQDEHAKILAGLVRPPDQLHAEAFDLWNEIHREQMDEPDFASEIGAIWKSAMSLDAGSTGSGTDEAKQATAVFVDDSEPAGLKFTYRNGETEIRQMPVALGGGVGLIDFDNDGDLDVYAVQGGPFPFDPKETAENSGDRLFRNLGGGRFEDCTEAAGLPSKRVGYGLGVTVGDVNGDGFPDLFVTRFGSYGLYLNEGGSRFRDVTEAWGLGGERDWPSSAAFADFDNDGDLDLYVCHYVVWDAGNPRLCRNAATGRYMSCNPTTCAAMPDRMFRNDGGKFVDVSDSAGITAADTEGRGLGVIAADFDDDGRTDLFVANDKSANFLFRNLGGMKFEEIAQIAGVAAGSDGSYQAGMGVACGDYDNDGRMDIAVTNYYGESTTLYRNAGGMVFTDMTAATGLAAATRLRLGFGLAFADFDADGRLDLLSANGHTDDMGDVPYAMPAQLLMGTSSGRWRDATGEFPHSPLAVPRLGRGLAVGDLDGDGLVDALLLPQNEPMVFLKNSTTTKNTIVSVRLTGTRSNRDGVGARIFLKTERGVRQGQRFGGGSYQSASEPFVRFGVPEGDRVRSLEVHWPSGIADSIDWPFPDRPFRIVEGTGRAEPFEPQKRP